jgi:oxygen-independent coproporphyrinogen-3 oxidase
MVTKNIPVITPDLLARYDRPGPRYTSYPTAVEFHDAFRNEEYRDRLTVAANRSDEPLAFYTHLPFCEHRCLFCGCHVVASPHKDRVTDPYIARLKREAELVAERLGERRRVIQYHWGGGTPTYLSSAQMTEVFEHFTSLFNIEPGAEVAVEVDPRVTTTEQLETLRDLGFNRISFGVQDLDPEVQRLIGRIQPMEQTTRLVDEARRLGFGGVNVDLIYGLPAQRPDAFAETARAMVGLDIDRVAVYSFAHVPWLKSHQKKMPQDRFPDRNEKLNIFLAARAAFVDAGYVVIGMDHFAKPDDELAVALAESRLHRNFMGYSTLQADEMVGLGISAIGMVAGSFAQNHKKLSRYYELIDAGELPTEQGYVLSPDDMLRAEVIKSIMCNLQIDPSDISKRHKIDFQSYFADACAELALLEADNLVEVRPHRILVTPLGQFFVRNVAMCFDRYLPAATKRHTPTFSRTV